MKKKVFLNNENGAALIVCLLTLAVISALGAAALVVSATNQRIAGNYRRQAQAFYAAEAGLQRGLAAMRADITWRGNITRTVSEESMETGGTAARFSVTTHDARDDGRGVYDPVIQGGLIRLVSEGFFLDSSQVVAVLVQMSPDENSRAGSPFKAVVTAGGNSGAGFDTVNGFDEHGNPDTGMVLDHHALPAVNQEALKMFADVLVQGDLVDDTPGLTGFWKDPPDNTRPHIVHVSGNLRMSGDRQLYGIIFVEGTSVFLDGAVRVHGVIYAPNATAATVINTAGSPNEMSVMGQVFSGEGGVAAAGSHANVQLVKEYVDAFNNFGGARVRVSEVPGSWRQY
jgi:hypothetical protein